MRSADSMHAAVTGAGAKSIAEKSGIRLITLAQISV